MENYVEGSMESVLIKQIEIEGAKKDLLIVNGKIGKISDHIDEAVGQVINGKNKAIIPGLINMHTHAAMTLMRGAGEDMELKEWINECIWPIEEKLDDELVYWGTRLACLEMIKTGTTCFNDQYWNIEAAKKASFEMGLRSVHSFVIMDRNDRSQIPAIKEACFKTYEESQRWASGLNKFAIGLHSPYSVSEDMLVWGVEFARKRGLPVHIHVSETEAELTDSIAAHGVSPVKYLDSIGVLGPDVISAHTLWVDHEDIDILSRRGVNVVHNINSNLKLASGYKFKYKEMTEAGINVTLGTDGAASSNNLDMLEAMKTMTMVQKAWRKDPTVLPLCELLKVATVNGAKALRLDTGEIKEGKLADMILVDKNSYAFTPDIDFYANLIYSANSSCVDTVICNGKVLMTERRVAGEQEILNNVNKLYNIIF